jgi:hypothetical protein
MLAIDFLRRIGDRDMRMIDRAVALLWWSGRENSAGTLTTKQISAVLESAGYARQNVSRLDSQLSNDRRALRARGGGWRLDARFRSDLDDQYGSTYQTKLPPEPTASVVPDELFRGSRGYLERVVYQINASYDATLYDCCAVMCRRLLETLLIEVYEKVGRAHEIKTAEGHFLMFAGLLGVFEKDSAFQVGRNALRGLRDFKSLGDLSAHNRRFNARKDDIDRIRDGLRVASEELLHIAGLLSARPATIKDPIPVGRSA